MTESKTLFRTAGEALRFAFADRDAAQAPSAISALVGGATSEGRGLLGLTGAGNAAMIWSAVGDMDDLSQFILYAKYGPRTEVCKCCGNESPARRWAEVIRAISRRAACEALSGCISNNRLRDKIVARAFGERVVLGEVAEMVGVTDKTASAHNQKILRWLRGDKPSVVDGIKGHEQRADEEIHDRLTVAKIVGD